MDTDFTKDYYENIPENPEPYTSSLDVNYISTDYHFGISYKYNGKHLPYIKAREKNEFIADNIVIIIESNNVFSGEIAFKIDPATLYTDNCKVDIFGLHNSQIADKLNQDASIQAIKKNIIAFANTHCPEWFPKDAVYL